MKPEENFYDDDEYEVKCRKCGYEIGTPEPWKFCPVCGAEAEVTQTFSRGKPVKV
jgi:rubrerythrin